MSSCRGWLEPTTAGSVLDSQKLFSSRKLDLNLWWGKFDPGSLQREPWLGLTTKLVVRWNAASAGTHQHLSFCSEAEIWAGSREHALWWWCGEGFPAEPWAGELLWQLALAQGLTPSLAGLHSLLSQWGLLSDTTVLSGTATFLMQILVSNAAGLTDWGVVSHVPSCSCFLLASGYSGASSPNLPCTTMQGHKKCPPGPKRQLTPLHILSSAEQTYMLCWESLSACQWPAQPTPVSVYTFLYHRSSQSCGGECTRGHLPAQLF